MRVFTNPVGAGSLWFDNLATADGIPVAYDPQACPFIVLPGAELNSEMEHQTGEDTTTGKPRPKGGRGAAKANTIGRTPRG
ncbi:hypothetical protein SAMN05444340_101197 [Citreimonas salinaria]|uniref:Uncharacterized protein n=1 Tax=Citreimonas salinaria TaxID=321339 RepID=A0A1H3F7G5_9RHOB|nr:hypothetical protein SAMN05444340_101197 [Citreimonas salinaria]